MNILNVIASALVLLALCSLMALGLFMIYSTTPAQRKRTMLKDLTRRRSKVLDVANAFYERAAAGPSKMDDIGLLERTLANRELALHFPPTASMTIDNKCRAWFPDTYVNLHRVTYVTAGITAAGIAQALDLIKSGIDADKREWLLLTISNGYTLEATSLRMEYEALNEM